MVGNGGINMSDNGIAELAEQVEVANSAIDLSVDEQQVIEQMRAERNRQEFIMEYRELCQRRGLALAASVQVVDGRLLAAIDQVVTLNG
jgi:hypothetical protein